MDKEKILQDTIDIQDHTIDSVCNQLIEARKINANLLQSLRIIGSTLLATPSPRQPHNRTSRKEGHKMTVMLRVNIYDIRIGLLYAFINYTDTAWREIRLHLPFCYILIQWNYHTRHHQGGC